MNFPFFGLPVEIMQAVLAIVGFAQLAMAVFLAYAVALDAEKRRQASGLFLVGPWVWFLIVLLTGGYVGGLAYWLIHYSTLRHRHEHGTLGNPLR